MDIKTGRRGRLFYGWWIVVVSVIIVICGTGADGYLRSQLIEFVRQLGSSATQMGIALSISSAIGLVVSLAIGPLIDRFGPRKIMLIGIPLTCIGFIGLSFVSNLFTLYLFQGAFVGIGISAGFLLPAQTATANWFIRRRSLALAFICMASVLGKGLVDLLGEGIADQFSGQGAFLWLGIVLLVVGIPLALVVRHRPEQHGYLPDGKRSVEGETSELSGEISNKFTEVNFTLWQALSTRAFWLLTVGMSLAALVGSMATMWRVPLLTERGVNMMSALNIFTLTPLMGLVGIFLFGYLGDKFPKRYLLAIAVVLQSVSGLILMVAGNNAHIYLYMLVYGLGSGVIPLLLAIRADYFGRKAFATITVVMTFISALTGMLLGLGSSYLVIWIYEINEYVQVAFLLSMFVGLLTAVVFFFARPPSPPYPSLTPPELEAVQ